jgi:transposase InsO family protein
MVLTISSNDGPEFKKYTLDEFLSDVGIKHHYLAPYMLQQNGMAKRKSRKLMDAAQTM